MAPRSCPRCRASTPDATALMCWECGAPLEHASSEDIESAFAGTKSSAPVPARRGAGVSWRRPPTPVIAAAAAILVATVVWLAFLRSSGGGLPTELAGRSRIDVVDEGAVQREMAGIQRLGVEDPEVATYGTGSSVEIVVFTGKVEGAFELEGFLRNAAAFTGSRVSFTTIAGPPSWACATVAGAGVVFDELGDGETRLCQRRQGSTLVAFAVLGAASDLAAIADALS